MLHGELFESKKQGLVERFVGRFPGLSVLDRGLSAMLLLVSVIPVAWMAATLDLKVGFLFLLVLIGLPLVALCVFNLAFGLGMILFTACMVVFAAKYTSAPIGTLLDLLILVCLIGILLRQIKDRDWTFLKHPMSYMIGAWLFYNFLQVLNPYAESQKAWLYTVRTVAILQLAYMVGAYAFWRNRRALFAIVKMIIAVCFVGAIYGLKQQFIGFSAAEMAWIHADPLRHQLYFQWGMMRIPSYCYDPTTFGILMACFAIFCAALFFGVKKKWQKVALALMGLLALWAMAYTGTRTAFVLVPLGLFFYMGLILNRRVLIAGVFIALLGGVFILKSTSSGVVYRIQSAFRPTQDDSMNLRLANQKKIQPFIQSHPIGAGLGSCGVWGKRFNPDSWLSDFPHDSSFVRMAIELGWIGLILYTLFHYVVLRVGLYYFMRCRDPLIRSLYAGITVWCFMLAVACYAQEAILQQPMNVIYNIFLAVLVALKNFDPAFSDEQ